MEQIQPYTKLGKKAEPSEPEKLHFCDGFKITKTTFAGREKARKGRTKLSEIINK